MSFLKNLVENIKDDSTNIVADGKGSAEYTGCIDTGSYILNAVLSGSIYGGVPNNKISAFAGESATGKCARGSEKIQVYMTPETKKKLGL